MAAVTNEEPLIAWRQLSAIDRNGVTAAWSGKHARHLCDRGEP